MLLLLLSYYCCYYRIFIYTDLDETLKRQVIIITGIMAVTVAIRLSDSGIKMEKNLWRKTKIIYVRSRRGIKQIKMLQSSKANNVTKTSTGLVEQNFYKRFEKSCTKTYPATT